jgi:hypothetical protein
LTDCLSRDKTPPLPPQRPKNCKNFWKNATKPTASPRGAGRLVRRSGKETTGGMPLGYTVKHFNFMKGIWIIAVIELLNTGLSKAGDYTGTNSMPEQIHNRMETEGYAIDQRNFSPPKQSTNLLGNLRFIENKQFIAFELPAKKADWSLWNNSNIKRVGRNTDQISVVSPYAALAQYEYEITYSFDF